MRKLTLTLLFFSSLVFAGSPYKKLSGSYHIGSAPIHDSKKKLPQNTHLYLSFRGKPAQEMYGHIGSEAQYSECGVNHYYKNTSNLQCSYYPSTNEYTWNFSINIKEGIIDSGGWC